MNTAALNLSGSSYLPVIRQSEASECGFACLAMIANYYGFKIDIITLRRKYTTSLQGMSLRSLIKVAGKLNLASRPVKAPLELVRQVHLPAIVHWDMNHFVVLKTVSKYKYVIHDPACGERIYTEAEFSQHFTGVALELTPTKDFKKRYCRFKIDRTLGADAWFKKEFVAGLCIVNHITIIHACQSVLPSNCC